VSKVGTAARQLVQQSTVTAAPAVAELRTVINFKLRTPLSRLGGTKRRNRFKEEKSKTAVD
jgi:hypothetical protein